MVNFSNSTNIDKKGVCVAILLGWCGGYRFYKKQYVLGFVYLFTCGIFCIGWIADIILALTPAAPDPVSVAPIEVARFHTKAVGVTYPTTQGGCSTRQEALEFLRSRRKDKLHIEYFEYNGTPAYRIIHDRNYSDIGNLSADLAEEIYRKYKDCDMRIVDWEVTGGDDGANYGCNIELAFYKN